MIPTNRPVLGKDLDSLRQTLGILTNEACFVFGMSITKWTELKGAGADEPLSDPTLALLIRLLDMNPELPVLPKYPSPQEMFDLINDIQQTEQKPFALLFGSEGSATYRWLQDGARVSPAVARLMYYLRLTLLNAPPSKREKLLKQWRDVVSKEGSARGVEDVFKSFAWNTREDGKASQGADEADEAKPVKRTTKRPATKAIAATPDSAAAEPAKRVTKRSAPKSK